MTRALDRRLILTGLVAASLAVPLLPQDAIAATKKKKKNKAAVRSNYVPIERAALENGEPLHVVVSLNEQKAHVYAGTRLIGSSPISSGKPGHETPQGIFTVMEKRRHHKSNLYSNAPMPYMQRLTWSGIALHEGHLPGGPASHGCVRLPRDFAADLFSLETRNRHVVIAGDMPQMHPVASPLLFQPRLQETASLDPASGTAQAAAGRGADDKPLRIYLTRHTGKHRLERVQHMLSRLGFYNGDQDGLMGRATWRALVDFQLAAGLKPTGVIKGATLPVLEAAFGVEETPAGHLYVRQAQEPVFDMPVHLADRPRAIGHAPVLDGQTRHHNQPGGLGCPYHRRRHAWRRRCRPGRAQSIRHPRNRQKPHRITAHAAFLARHLRYRTGSGDRQGHRLHRGHTRLVGAPQRFAGHPRHNITLKAWQIGSSR